MKTKVKISIMAILLMVIVAISGCTKPPINPGTVPDVTTIPASNITKTSAVVGGNITNSGGHDITARGVYFSVNNYPADKGTQISGGVGSGKFNSTLANLTLNTTYYYMAYATNSLGISYGQILSFTTSNRDASLSISYSNLTTNKVSVQIGVTPYGSTITETGVCFSSNDTPTTTDNKIVSQIKNGQDTISITGLTSNAKYYIRAYAVTDKGTLYSPEIEIWVYDLMDIDGNGYHAVKIGTQTYTLENLRVTHYRNGDPIPNITDDMAWHNDKKGAYCYYDNNKAKYDSLYGALYNFYAVEDPRGLAPKGWHIPSDDEVENVLARFLGMSVNSLADGGKLKETGTEHWKAPNTGATNAYGFTGLPAGGRWDLNQSTQLGAFSSIHTAGFFWTKAFFAGGGLSMFLVYNSDAFYFGAVCYYNDGFSVRLIKN